jgi:hypothetical protein
MIVMTTCKKIRGVIKASDEFIYALAWFWFYILIPLMILTGLLRISDILKGALVVPKVLWFFFKLIFAIPIWIITLGAVNYIGFSKAVEKLEKGSRS